MSRPWGAAIIGSGNIGTDLMIKIRRRGRRVRMVAMVGVDPSSDGLARARRLGHFATADGIEGLLGSDAFDDVDVVFDATSASAHLHNWDLLEPTGRRVLDLTPASIGPYVVPVVNLGEHATASNVNMVTCGGQATVPIVAAISDVGPVAYAEIVSSIASRSAGPGTRANIDEFTETTARALRVVGGAARSKAVIILNPAEPPLLMRNTVYCLVENARRPDIERSVHDMVARVQSYVPGYRLKQAVQFEEFDDQSPLLLPETGKFVGTRVTVLLEVTGAAHYLPDFAGNLDIMTSAALATAEHFASAAGAGERPARDVDASELADGVEVG